LSRFRPPKASQPATGDFVQFATYWRREDLRQLRALAAELGTSANHLVVAAVLHHLVHAPDPHAAAREISHALSQVAQQAPRP
jgi:hypothetical protein